MVFDCALRNVEPKLIPVAPFIAGARNQLNDLHRGLAGLWRKCTGPKLSNLISDHPFLPVQTIVLREDFDRWLPAVRSRRPDIFRQGHHGIRRHILHVDRGHPRHTKIHRVAGAQLLLRHSAQRLLRRRVGQRRSGGRRRRGQHRYVPSAAAGGLLHTGQISGEQEQGGKTSSERIEKAVRVFAERGKIKFKTRRSPSPFIHRARRFGKPAIQQYGVNQRSCQKPPRNHFERGQSLHHLATSSAPDDFVELVPRRANVGAKAKTPPFTRGLRHTRCANSDKTTGRLTLRLIRRRTKTCDEVVSSCDLVQNGGPRAIRPIVTGPAWPLRVTGLICKGLPVITVCDPALWEYSGDNLGV
jgi:hypothetical protein